jgi:hypothetical protein
MEVVMKRSILGVLVLVIALAATGCFSHKHDDHAHHDHGHHHHNHDHDLDGSGIHHHDGPLGAHVHGEMNLSLVVENNLLTYELSGAADGLLGFEHAPKTEEEQRAWANLRSYWSRERLLEIFQFNRDLNCHIHESDIQMLIPDKGHANLLLNGLIMCEKAVQDVRLTLSFHKDFQNLHKLSVEALPDGKSPMTREFKSSEQIEIQL